MFVVMTLKMRVLSALQPQQTSPGSCVYVCLRVCAQVDVIVCVFV